MNWTSLAYTLVIIVIVISLFLMWAWPRREDGTFMSMEEVDEFLKRFPRGPSEWIQQWVLLIFMGIAMIGIALTPHHDNDHDDHH